ncbi:MAG: DUF4113 domain-containing protein [Nodosilinea sp. WJT8-NPBG4]|nr:DUF4113 domain-containing protein [Nodosilinea sp. WJT8-NPBG4]
MTLIASDQVIKLSPDAVKFGAMGLKPTWSMRSEYFSPRYTTHRGRFLA